MAGPRSIQRALYLAVLVLALVGHLWVHADRHLHVVLEDEGHAAAPYEAGAELASTGPEADPHLIALVACLVILSALVGWLLGDRLLRCRLVVPLSAHGPPSAWHLPPASTPTPIKEGVLLRV